MESNAVDVYAAKKRLCRDMRLLDAYAAGTPVCGIAKQMGMTSLEVAVQLRALLNDHAWLLDKKCPQIDAAATGSRIFEYLNARKISLPELCHYLGYSAQETPHRWREGKNLPPLKAAYATSLILGIPINDFIVTVPE